jgi:hypothetical protein
MKASVRMLVASVLFSLIAIAPTAARAQTATPGPCIPGTLPSGALSLICVPSHCNFTPNEILTAFALAAR